MNNDEQERRNRKILIWGVVIFVGIVVASIIGILYNDFVRKTKIVEIANYGEYLPDFKEQELEEQLRNLMQTTLGVEEDVLVKASIRDDSYEQEYDEEVYAATFLVDVDEYKQTYLVYMSWSDTVEIPNSVLISCPDVEDMKYEGVECVGMYNDTQSVEEVLDNPLYDELPVAVEWFDFASRVNNRYELRGYFDDDGQLVVMIVDYSGGNYENALAKIREMGYNPDDYGIEYLDKSGS